MIVIHDLKFKCPVCGHVNVYKHREVPPYGEVNLVYCDMDTGGCDQQIVLEIGVEIKHKATAYKIEGFDYGTSIKDL